tara:strand:+ start:89 stop:436 length:348 start_codon:yes stop_codon:yes gene_type:complete
MPKFSDQMRCSCGSSIFSRSEIIVTDPGKVHPTGDYHLKCLICLRDLVYDREKSCLKGITREEGKKFLVDSERKTRELCKPKPKLEAVAQAINPSKGSDTEKLTPEDIDEGSFGD